MWKTVEDIIFLFCLFHFTRSCQQTRFQDGSLIPATKPSFIHDKYTVKKMKTMSFDYDEDRSYGKVYTNHTKEAQMFSERATILSKYYTLASSLCVRATFSLLDKRKRQEAFNINLLKV